nr:hypothetical protein Iba_chr01dCG8960 [Ipomoea batatas]
MDDRYREKIHVQNVLGGKPFAGPEKLPWKFDQQLEWVYHCLSSCSAPLELPNSQKSIQSSRLQVLEDDQDFEGSKMALIQDLMQRNRHLMQMLKPG